MKTEQTTPTATDTAKLGSPTRQQVGKRTVVTFKGRRGWAVVAPSGNVVPRDICGIASGSDAWMRDIKFPCEDCGELFAAKDLNPAYCEACVAKDFEQEA